MSNNVIDITDDGSWLDYNNPSGLADFWLSIDIAFDSTFLAAFANSADAATFLLLAPVVGGAFLYLGFRDNSGVMDWYWYDGPSGAFAGSVLTAMQFYRYEFHFMGGTSPPSIDVYVDGTHVGSNTNLPFGLPNVEDIAIEGASTSIYPGHFYFDNFKLGTTQGATDIFSDDFEAGVSGGWSTNNIGSPGAALIADPGITPYSPPPSGTTYTESATISSKTSISYLEHGPYLDLATPSSKTTPDVIVEIPTVVNLYVDISGSSFVGSVITATITTEVTGGTTGGGGGGSGGTPTDPDAPGYVVTYSPAGQWGTADNDNGVIP